MRSTSENTSTYHNKENTHNTTAQSKLSSSTSASVADVYENGQNNINVLKLKYVYYIIYTQNLKIFQNIILENFFFWFHSKIVFTYFSLFWWYMYSNISANVQYIFFIYCKIKYNIIIYYRLYRLFSTFLGPLFILFWRQLINDFHTNNDR